ncbi:MAG: hypothetical protein ACKN9T_04625 [Candidatus Methylumidiphilus sp.]
MARKKTVAFSRKPAAETGAQDIESAANPAPAAAPETAAPPSHDGPAEAPLSLQLQPVETAAERDTALTPTLNPFGAAVYGTVFCLSYGLMFSALLLGACLPGSALVGRAWQAGTGSARRDFDGGPT